MKYILAVLLTITSFISFSQSVKVIQVDELVALVNSDKEKIQVINFWATWCGPCIKELPFIEEVAESMKSQVDVQLITVDFVDDLTKVEKFVERKQLKSNVYLIDNVDYNSWIDKVDERWSGAIPATVVINPVSGDRRFVERELKEGELESIIEELL
ncbi:TlpA family protein disulfide reductase [Fulvivirga lutea]|uniref:TlpA family protein disulfide reductase n=1 Tax=Fulvivirga lutea TaxID=2810512 RepID=A0A975A196_9BACT|nr:TlpA disulfide reductase family protein [Fulvivirga lutea]QSE98005.1 TlpA family protein disulfide reductase [Fulvivirga lutea]